MDPRDERTMHSTILMPVEEYLRTSFEEADQDYVDGALEERHVGELPHSTVQGRVLSLLGALPGLGLRVLPEIRIQISPTRYRVADVAAWRPGPIGDRVPAVPPFLAVEILSPEDRLVRLQPKIQDYLRAGVEHVWVIDPWERRALAYSRTSPGGELTDVLQTASPPIDIPLPTVLAALDGLQG
jgi:Uma2 family endonuclease